MSRKRRTPTARIGSEQAIARVAVRQPLSRRSWVAAAVALLAIAVVVARLGIQRGRGASFPPPAPAPPQPAVDFADFVGAATCAPCHTTEYEAWTRSTHGRAGGQPTPERVIAPFNRRPLRFRDAVVTPSRTETGAYLFTVAQSGRPVQVLRVDAVVGGGFMAGGGTQTFFSKFPDGTVRFLPFDFSRASNGWVCNTNGRANRNMVAVGPEISLADCGDWPPSRVLGSSDDGINSCQQCHGSQILRDFDADAKRYVTRYTTLAVNCESCHGPGRQHVALVRAGRTGEAADIGMRDLATLTKHQSLAVCFQCHSIKTALEPGYLPGKGLQQHFALKFPGLLDTLYFADGRTRAFAYQEGHLSSDCYRSGSMTCVDCHDPHTQKYRDIYRAPLPGRFSDGQCLDCHASKADQVERHTHHAATSPGSRCTACHMPYLQEPSVGTHIRYARADHTIGIPRPLYDSRLGIDDGCMQCHRDQPAQHLDAQIAAWYGQLKPLPSAVVTALRADSVADRLAAARLVLTDTSADGIAQFAGLSDFLARFISPDMPALERDIVVRLDRLAANPDLDVKALALAMLHLARGSDPSVRRVLARRLEASDSLDSRIRRRWIWILQARGNAYLTSGAYEQALAAYRKAQEILPDDPSVYRSAGIAYTRLRDYSRAIDAFKHSLALLPKQPQVLVELAFALAQLGDLNQAVTTYLQALALNPWQPSAHANLGMTYFQLGDVQQAIVALRQAVSLDPTLAAANFALADALQRSGERAEAVAALERGLEFDPGNASARQMLAALQPARSQRTP